MKKIVLIGSTGVIGKSLFDYLKNKNFDVIGANRSSNEYYIDIEKKETIKAFFEKHGQFDIVINASGHGGWKPFAELNESDYQEGLNSKLMGQVNLTHQSIPYLNEGGKIILTTGILTDFYEPNGIVLTLINNALDGFVRASYTELPNQIELKIVAPGALENTISTEKFAHHVPVSHQAVNETYLKAIEEKSSGITYKIY